LGLIMRGPVSYLVAIAWDYTDVRLYALHRFKKAAILDQPANIPSGFNLDEAIADGLANFANAGERIRLELRCAEWIATYLDETQLSADQEIKDDADGWKRLTATVSDTWQLRWWLMGQGSGIEVCAPQRLRDEIKLTISDATKLYA